MADEKPFADVDLDEDQQAYINAPERAKEKKSYARLHLNKGKRNQLSSGQFHEAECEQLSRTGEILEGPEPYRPERKQSTPAEEDFIKFLS